MPEKTQQREPIAIVGSSCRFPGPARNMSKLWELLQEPYDISTQIPPERFNIDAFYHPDPKHHGSINTRRAYFLEEDHRLFDAPFFQINASEAETMDPQQRILLETVYEAMEAGGHSIESMQGSHTAVFVGGMSCDFRDTVAIRDPASIPEYSATGTHDSILAARISYFFDWKGPCMSINTACSSSLVAVHLAVQALRNLEATTAVVAGSNLNLGPEQFIALSNLRMLSPNGRVRMWDENADGYARGEGFGAVILKTLSRAKEDGDKIECVIRETGVNQDGRTTGITMPNAQSQTALIREVYSKAGLDISNPTDRPQYFEAHGTGTPAGDPVEVEAIYHAFCSTYSLGTDDPLYVGSIKTVTGHLEGAAGIAGLLKASLAVQNGMIPPNLHFKALNPKIARYYDGIKIPTGSAQPWPALPGDTPRRASVNSFGFGGTNAHIIVESHKPECRRVLSESLTIEPLITPLTVSAKSERALARRVEALAEYIERYGSQVNLESLIYTLQTRQSQFAFRRAFTSDSLDNLVSSMRKGPHISEKSTMVSSRSTSTKPRLLGIFTGQGAQSARMGAELIEYSAAALKKLEYLEEVLNSLPDPPSWSLTSEILAPVSSSRIAEAALSQPLCTALQIILVDHLHASGIKFSVVLGHSSGEIAAAYAAGILSARDAICIAYYRGQCAKLAKGDTGHEGAMMATGMSFEDSKALCEQIPFVGRLYAAASNSPSNSTLSGDAAAVHEAKALLDKKGTFARPLVVDTAYHSHHMHSVSGAYIEALQQCGIAPCIATQEATFASSVYNTGDPHQDLGPQYWKDNMVRPVLFSQAIESAVVRHGPFDMVLEVGPHPALRGPATETLEACGYFSGYYGTLERGKDSIQALSETLGCVYEHIRSSSICFEDYRKMFLGKRYRVPSMVPDLPSYPWDHDKPHYRESRTSHCYLHDVHPEHAFLGRRMPHDNEHEMRWRHVISLDEVPWLSQHTVQGQAVVPAMWYVVMALEASLISARGACVEMIEITNFQIDKAIPMDDGDAVETIFSFRTTMIGEEKHAEFWCMAGSLYGKGSLDLVFSGELTMIIGEDHEAKTRSESTSEDIWPSMASVDTSDFYNFLGTVGYGYYGRFRSLEIISKNKRDGQVRSIASEATSDGHVHPATLDLALQSLLAAHFNLDDNGMPLVVPNSINRLTLYPQRCKSRSWEFNAVVTNRSPDGISGDIDITDKNGRAIGLIESVSWRPMTAVTSANDRKMFYTTVWEWDILHGNPIAVSHYTEYEMELARACDRVAAFYYSTWKRTLSTEEWANAKWHHRRLLAYIEQLLPSIAAGDIPTVIPYWMGDTKQDIDDLLRKYPDSADLLLMEVVGESLPVSVRQKRPMLEFMLQDERLANYYRNGLGYERCYDILKTMIRRMVHRYPRMRILEIGAGTGGATRHILNAMGDKFLSYTFTDISSGFFEKAEESIGRESGSKMLFRTFDLEKDALDQGFGASTFDLVIGSLVVHATESIERTLSSLRSLIKPGGYLLLVEGSAETLRSGFMMAGLPGWWVGDESRKWGPMIGLDRWDRLLRKTGFSGIDHPVKDCNVAFTNLGVVFASQAVIDSVSLLRGPLENSKRLEHMTIVGSKALWCELTQTLSPHSRQLIEVGSLSKSLPWNVPKGGPVLVLSEYEEPMFKSMTFEKLKGMQELCKTSNKILVITHICEAAGAYASAMLGLLRSLRLEIPHIRIQTIGLRGKPSMVDMKRICESFIRLAAWPEDEDVLWTFEPEMELVDGALRLPRLVEDGPPTGRLNSQRRFITSEVDPREMPVEVVKKKDTGKLFLRYPQQKLDNGVSGDLVAVTYSVVQPLFLGSRPYYLCVGRLTASSIPVVAMGLENRSILNPTVVYNRGHEGAANEVKWLALIAYHIFAQECLRNWKGNGICILHDADDCLKIAFQDVCCQEDAELRLSSSSKREGHLYLPPHASKRKVQKLLSRNTLQESVLIIDCSVAGISGPVKATVPEATYLEPFSNLHGILSMTKVEVFGMWLKAATAFASRHLDDDDLCGFNVGVSPPSNLHTTSPRRSKLSVIDWNGVHTVPVLVRSVTESFQLFRDNKTYLLVGLTGDMGRILVDWMVEHGARYFALASRNPATITDWSRELEEQGAVVKIYEMDVSDKAAVQNTRYTMAEDHFPPVGGIANGAMVLRDTSFYEMRHEQMVDCLRPKVDGSRNLDEVFGDLHLDFFVLFSSLAYTLGNPGQSNYAAANGFMEGIAKERRQRGHAASIISLGVVGGVGYLARTRHGTEREHARKRNVLTISPDELCTIFAEGIIAGRPESGHEVEVITGLDGCIDTETIAKAPLAPWLKDPRVSHIIKDRVLELDTTAKKLRTQVGEAVPLKVQLSSEKDEVAAQTILTTAFSAKLERMSLMQVGGNTTIPLTELGVDSLLAIEIRSWFMSELDVEVPVLKVLGGGTVAEIVKSALDIFQHATTSAASTSLATKKKLSPDSKNVITTGTNSEGEPEATYTTRHQVATMTQARMYRLHRFTSGAANVNNMSWSYRITGALDVPRFEIALQAVLRPYESLRTRFSALGEQTMQTVLQPTSFPLERMLLSTEIEIDALFDQVAQMPHDPTTGKLVSAALVEKSPMEHIFIMSFHHIAVDTRSCEILLADLKEAYTLQSTFVSSHVTARTHPADYASLEAGAQSSGAWTQSINYWKESLAGADMVLPLFPCAQVDERRILEEYHLAADYAYLSRGVVEQVKAACREVKCSPYHFHTAVLTVLLHQLTGLGSIVIGSVDAGRDTHQSLNDAFGPMFNYLPLYLRDISNRKTFKDLIRYVRDTSYAARSHAQVPFDVIVDAVGEERMPATHHPIYQAQINYLKHNLEEVPLGRGLNMSLRDARGVEVSYDFCVSVLEGWQGEGARIAFETQDYLYNINEVKELGKTYIDILSVAAESIDTSI